MASGRTRGPAWDPRPSRTPRRRKASHEPTSHTPQAWVRRQFLVCLVCRSLAIEPRRAWRSVYRGDFGPTKMAKQKFTPPHRRAIWTAYGMQCFYCHERLRWDDLRIDHLVPEYLSNDPDALRTKLNELGLPETWDLQGNANLVASCDRCNNRKGARTTLPSQLILLTAETRAKATRIEELRQKFETEDRKDLILAQLETARGRGLLTSPDVDRLRLLINSDPHTPVQLLKSLRFLEGAAFTELRPSEAERLLDLPVLTGAGANLPNGLEFVRADGSEIKIRTSREYRDAIANGYYAKNNFFNKMAAFFTETLGALSAMQACRPAERSFIRDPPVGLPDIHLLPSSLLFTWAPDESSQELVRTHETIGALVGAGHAKIVSVASHRLEIQFGTTYTYLREILRSDLDGDGCEDVLIFEYAAAVGGTFGHGSDPYPLARRGPNDLFCRTQVVPVPATSAQSDGT